MDSGSVDAQAQDLKFNSWFAPGTSAPCFWMACGLELQGDIECGAIWLRSSAAAKCPAV